MILLLEELPCHDISSESSPALGYLLALLIKSSALRNCIFSHRCTISMLPEANYRLIAVINARPSCRPLMLMCPVYGSDVVLDVQAKWSDKGGSTVARYAVVAVSCVQRTVHVYNCLRSYGSRIPYGSRVGLFVIYGSRVYGPRGI